MGGRRRWRPGGGGGGQAPTFDPEQLAQVRARMKAHSYAMGGQDPRKLLQ
eukprot:COSAG02_NODE_42157_length_387_cov_0.798611_1_plen_49_part_01